MSNEIDTIFHLNMLGGRQGEIKITTMKRYFRRGFKLLLQSRGRVWTLVNGQGAIRGYLYRWER